MEVEKKRVSYRAPTEDKWRIRTTVTFHRHAFTDLSQQPARSNTTYVASITDNNKTTVICASISRLSLRAVFYLMFSQTSHNLSCRQYSVVMLGTIHYLHTCPTLMGPCVISVLSSGTVLVVQNCILTSCTQHSSLCPMCEYKSRPKVTKRVGRVGR